MARVLKYTVMPKLPERLLKLSEIANNLWWCWDPEAVELFFRMDRDLWVQVGQNPRRLLGEISQERLRELSDSGSFLAHLERVVSRLETYMANGEWCARHQEAPDDLLVAYFSAEFGLHESVNIYSGGLGLLAGDHLKAASDLGLPLVGVGMLYREGYFRQYLNADGWQQELYPKNDFHNMPIGMLRDDDGHPKVIEVPYPGRQVKAHVWRCQVGRIPLYLLDSDHEENQPADRTITGQLYGGDRETRIKQEIMLGMGGVIALKALGLHPTVYHINEGHAAFMTLQRIKNLMERDHISFDEALEVVKIGSIFTTHTPVPAGNDMFDPALISTYFEDYCRILGIPLNSLLALGRQVPHDTREPFCMTVLALKLSSKSNGVSILHGQVARNMWSQVWKGVPIEELPISSITNGVHIPSWMSRDLAGLYDRYLGPDWRTTPHDQSVWERIVSVPDTELWRTHERRRERLVNFARRRMVQQLVNRGAPASEARRAGELLDSEALTIGFARRFAMYKRGTLILRNPERLRRILLNPDMPVQIIVAGKAHPQDAQSKELIRQFIHFAHQPDLRNHILFIEDYDINVARYMLQGVDCWLNTPRRPMEASGTSGMKAAANGALNISIPDGWWCEAETMGENGWSIGKGESYETTDEQDQVESEALYEILEKEVAPMFYNRGRDGLPREWIARMKIAIRTISPAFNTYRMVLEYADRFYIPCCKRRHHLFRDDRKPAYQLAAWKARIREHWPEAQVARVHSGATEGLHFGGTLQLTAEVRLGPLKAQDVAVEVFYGMLGPGDLLTQGNCVAMECIEDRGGGVYMYQGAAPCNKTGQLGCAIRIRPWHPDFAHDHEMGLIAWA